MSETLDINELMQIIPHRYPFLLVDRVTDIVAGQSCTGLKNVTINEPFFQGHFPDFPVMPGVLVVEAMAQTSVVLVCKTIGAEQIHHKSVLLMSIDKAKFRKPVLPGDTLILRVRVEQNRGNVWKFNGTAEVDGKIVAEATFCAMAFDKNENKSSD